MAICMGGATFWTWRKWGDVLVDFGFELVAPWQISEGKVLYRDLEWVFGPISQYYHALLFRLFGVSATTLIVANLLLVGGLALGMYRMFARMADATTATAVSVVLLLAFAFSQYTGIGNYNYIFAYSNEVVHGLVLGILAVGLMARWVNSQSPRVAAAAGLCVGSVFLTKPELFVAVTALTAVSLFLAFRLNGILSTWKRSIAFFLVAAATPPVAFGIYFVVVMGTTRGVRATLTAWTAISQTVGAGSNFYKWCFGFDKPWDNALTMATHAMVVLLTVSACAWLCRWSTTARTTQRVLSIVLLISLVGSAAVFRWGQCGRSLPVLTLGMISHLGYLWSRSVTGTERKALVTPLLWMTFSLALLPKMGLNARIWHYGFAIAMPATVGVVYYLSWFLPKELARLGVRVPVFRVTMLGFFAVGLMKLVALSNRFYEMKTYAIGRDGDTIFTYNPKNDSAGPYINSVINWLKAHSAPGSTLSVLPEGLMVNFQTRRPLSASHHSLALMAGGGIDESAIVSDFDRLPPDHIVIVHRDTREFGVRFWGEGHDYGAQMMTWIKRRYNPVYLVGAEPMQSDRFGIQIWKRFR